MDGIRIAIGVMPRMLREIVVNAIMDGPGMTIVEGANLPAGADVVVVESAQGELNELGRRFLREQPALKVVGISHDGRFAVLHELTATHTTLREVTPDTLREAILRAVDRPAF